jgi:hypothetical protein
MDLVARAGALDRDAEQRIGPEDRDARLVWRDRHGGTNG